MGIEGVGSKETLQKVLATGQQVLHIGHLSLLTMEGKVANGEWRWIDEAGCSMHTATNKPALLRSEVRTREGNWSCSSRQTNSGQPFQTSSKSGYPPHEVRVRVVGRRDRPYRYP